MNKTIKIRHLLVLGVGMVLLLLLLGLNDVVKAVDPSSERTGYYKGNSYYADGEGRAVLAGGFIGVNSKATYLNFLQNKNLDSSLNAGGYPQNRDGSAFIVCSMLGSWPASDCRNSGYINSSNTVTSAGWNRLTLIINNTGTDFRIQTVSSNINTIYSLSQKDFYYVSIPSTDSAFIFSQTVGGVYREFRIFIDCANPLGGLGLVIDDIDWNVTATLTADRTMVNPGGEINWSLRAVNNGPSNLTMPVNFAYQNQSRSGGLTDNNYGPNLTIPSGWAPNVFTSANSTKTSVPLSATSGSQFCRRSVVYQTASVVNSLPVAGNVYGNPVCVTVVTSSVPVAVPPVVGSNRCRPINFVVEPRSYPAVSHVADNGTLYYTAARTVPVSVSTSRQSFGTFYSNSTVDATANHTTGDTYTVTFTETDSHVSSYTDHFNTRGSEIMDTSAKITGYEQGPEITYQRYESTTSTTGVTTWAWKTYSYIPKIYAQGDPIYDYGPRSYVPQRYNWLYSGTTTNYTSPASWTTSIGPCYNYALTANVNNFAAKLEAGATATVTPSVTSTVYSGIGTSVSHTKSMSTTWYISTITVPSNSQLSYISGGRSNISPCNYFNPSYIGSCTTTSGNTVFNTSGTPSGSIGTNLTAPDSTAGTKVCVAFSVRNEDGWDESSTNSMYSHSSFDPMNNCITVVRKPKVQVWGGDIWSRGLVQTSKSLKLGTVYGSWSEYGIFASGAINNIASGAAFSNLSGLPSSTNICSYSMLSFTNVPTGGTACTGVPGTIGNYSSSARDIPDVSASFPISSTTPVITSGDISGRSGVYTANGSINITGGNISKGRWIVINAPNQNITISGNINYTTERLYGIGDIPQVVIIGSRIDIDNNVTNIDAWLISRGDINTCSGVGVSASISINDCNNRLLVNGPIMANKLYLRRTAGSGTGADSNLPAEIFNTRPDAYLWAFSKANTSGRAQTVYATEVPARF